MKTTLFFTGLTLIFFYTLGLGLTLLLVPKRLREYTLWLAPWYLIVALIFVLVITSLLGFSVEQVYLPILLVLLSINYYAFVIKKYRLPLKFPEDIGTLCLVGGAILLSISPLFLKTKFLTTLSLGNNDIIAYATTADFLRNYSIVTSFTQDTMLAIANLLRDGFRWGTPIIESFFLSLYRLQAYQISYLLQAIFFGMMAPLVGVLVSHLTKRSMRTMWLGTFLTMCNVNMLYMLYHNFFGQVMYWGIALLLTLLFFVYFTGKDIYSRRLTRDEICIALTIVVLFFTYHEPMIFIISPLVLYALIRQLQDLRHISVQLGALLRIAGICLMLGSYSIINALIFDFTQAFRGNPDQPIGWQLFRSQTPYASPFEAMGMWSIHNFAPLPLPLSIVLSLLVASMILIGLWYIRFRLLYLCYAAIFIFFYYWTGIYQHNFFFYNRALTYTLPFFLVLFVAGWERIYQRNKLLGMLGVLITVALVSWSAMSLNRRFIQESTAVDLSYTTIGEVQKLQITEPIYYVGEVVPTSIWQHIWAEYFLYPTIRDQTFPRIYVADPTLLRVPDQAYILAPKTTPWIKAPRLVLGPPIWESAYWQLARLCNSSSCLAQSSEDLSQIIFSNNTYEDTLLLTGWSAPEPDGRWTSARTSTLRLFTKQAGYTQVVVEAQSLSAPQEMSIEIDGQTTLLQSIETTWQTYTYSLPSVLPPGLHLITLHFSHVYTPAEVLGNQDMRTLAVRLRSIRLVR